MENSSIENLVSFIHSDLRPSISCLHQVWIYIPELIWVQMSGANPLRVPPTRDGSNREGVEAQHGQVIHYWGLMKGNIARAWISITVREETKYHSHRWRTEYQESGTWAAIKIQKQAPSGTRSRSLQHRQWSASSDQLPLQLFRSITDLLNKIPNIFCVLFNGTTQINPEILDT